MSSGTGSRNAKKPGFDPPSTTDLEAVLDAYEFIEMLGRGGMGAVYKARQKSLDRIVAIKILPSGLDAEGDEEGASTAETFRFSERFQREARAMAKLNHPNIIGVYDFGQASDGQFYFVMEFVEGRDLHALIRTGEMTTAHVAGWISQICEALQYAHDKGIVHRDIKPANIMITLEGHVKVADFGLALLTGAGEMDSKLTMTNMAMGTPDYIAPEALDSDLEIDHRADLYAVGVMLYEMLTGKVPRGAWKLPSEQLPGLDVRYDNLVVRAMDADRDGRFQQAREIGATVYEIATTPVPGAAEHTSRPKLLTGTPVETGSSRSTGAKSAPHPDPSKGRTKASAIPPKPPDGKKRSITWIAGGGGGALVAVLVLFFVFKKDSPHAGALEVPSEVPGSVKTAEAGRSNPPSGSELEEEPLNRVATPSIPEQPPAPPVSEPLQSPVDLLATVDLTRDAGSGEWTRVTDGLAVKLGDDDHETGGPRLQFAKEVPEEYDLEAEFTLTGGEGIIALKLWAGNKPFRLALNQKKGEQYLSGFEEINLNLEQEAKGVTLRRPPIPNGQRVKLRAEVRRGELRAFLDDKPLVSWPGDYTSSGTMRGERRPGLSSYFRAATFHRVTLTALGQKLESTPADTPGQRDDSFTFQGHRYQFFPDKLNWNEAKVRAESLGGHLATVTNREENDWIAETFIKKLPTGMSLWLGGTNGGTNGGTVGTWGWITGEPFEFTNWAGGEPHNRTAEPALAFSFQESGETGWADLSSDGMGSIDRRGGFLVEWSDDGVMRSTAKPPAPPLDGTVDLLALVEVERDALRGEWEKTPEGLETRPKGGGVSPAEEGVQLLRFNRTAPKEYDFEIEFTLKSGVMEAAQVMPRPGGAFFWKMGLGGGNPTLFCFGPDLDGKSGKYDATRAEAMIPRPRLSANRRYRSVVEVRNGSLRALLDDEEVLQWSGDFARLSSEPAFGLPGRESLGLATFDTVILFHKAELRPPTQAAAPSEPMTEAPPAAVPHPAAQAPPSDPRLVQLEAGFQARYEAEAHKPFEAALAALNRSYVANGIARARAAAQKSGDLDGVTALDAEKSTIEGGDGVPAEDAANTPDVLKTLRRTYRSALSKHEVERDARAAPLLALYLEALDAYVTELTKAGKIEEARQVKSLRDAKAQGTSAPSANLVETAPETTQSPPLSGVAPDDPGGSAWRRASQWLLDTGSTMIVTKGGMRVEVKTPGDLPSGKFDIVEIHIDPIYRGRPVPKDRDFSMLDGLRDLRRVTVIAEGLSDAAFAFLEGNDELEYLRIENSADVSDRVLDHVAGAKKLNDLTVRKALKFTGEAFAGSPLHKSLRILTLIDSGITDKGLEAISKCSELTRFTAHRIPVSDSGCTVLGSLETLTHLDLEGTAFGTKAAEALAGLTDLEYINLEITRISPADVAKWGELKNLKEFRIRRGNPQIDDVAFAEIQDFLPGCLVR